MSNFLTRPASDDDLQKLLELEQGIILSERPYDPYLRESDVSYYDIPALINDADSHLIVVESEGNVIGCGYAQIRQSKACHSHDQHCYLGFVYLEPEYRGNSLGKLILDALQAVSYTHLTLPTTPYV